MTIESWTQKAVTKLDSNSIPTARLDAEVLLSDILDKDRTWIHAHPEYILTKSTLRKLDEQIKRRMKHEPLAYIRARQEFYGRDFIVSPDTLTPRPETETLIEFALKSLQDKKSKIDSVQITDVGTGSGCIIISMALEMLNLKKKLNVSYTGLDISEPALKIAKKNAKHLKANVIFKKFDLLSESFNFQTKNYNLVLANLPYVPNSYEINLSATHEPGFAIFGGKDGLDYYRLLFQRLDKDGNHTTVITESLPPQHQELTNIALSAGFELSDSQDLIQVFSN